MDRVKCSIIFYYDPETFLYEHDENIPTDEEVFHRCKIMMIEDITDLQNPIDIYAIDAEFVRLDNA